MSENRYPSNNKNILSEKDILDINIPVEIKENNEDILLEKDILDINTPVEIEEKNKEKDIEI
jgi:hypothetical protein